MTRRLIIALVLAFLLVLYVVVQPPLAPQPSTATRWQKLDAQGKPVAPWAGPWHCVHDRQTGLVWEVKSDNESIHDAYWTYSWFDGKVGEARQGDCFFAAQRCDTQLLVSRVNETQRCGLSGWRLPSRAELHSLVVMDREPGKPTLANDFFPYARRGDYWTADGAQPLTGFYQYLGKGAWAINFTDGSAQVWPYRNAAYVRLVTTADQLVTKDSQRIRTDTGTIAPKQ